MHEKKLKATEGNLKGKRGSSEFVSATLSDVSN
jgi:hypothetical protein